VLVEQADKMELVMGVSHDAMCLVDGLLAQQPAWLDSLN